MIPRSPALHVIWLCARGSAVLLQRLQPMFALPMAAMGSLRSLLDKDAPWAVSYPGQLASCLLRPLAKLYAWIMMVQQDDIAG